MANSTAAAQPARRKALDLVTPVRTALVSLQDPHYRLYWVTNALFFIGQGLILMGAQWLMLDLTDSRSLLGAVGALQGLVVVLLSPLGGVLADRLPRRNILIVARALFALVSLAMAALVVTDSVRIWHVLTGVMLGGAILAFSQAATQTYVFDLVGRERVTNAIALNALGTGLFQIIGPSIGGALLGSIGPEGTYLAGGIGYGVGALVLVTVPILGKTANTKRAGSLVKNTLGDIAEGLAYIKSDRTLMWIFVMGAISFFGGAVTSMRVVFAREIFQVGPHGLAWLAASFGAGSLLGALLVAAVGHRIKYKGLTLLLAQLGWMTFTMIYAGSRWFGLNLALEVLMGALLPFFSAMLIAMLQIRVPERVRSRVLTVHFMLLAGMSINWWVTGQAADLLGDRQALALMGAIAATIDILMLLFVRRVVLLGSDKHPLVLADTQASAAAASPSA